jgi:hypothetical protein
MGALAGTGRVAVSEPRTIIAFDEGDLPPLGTYAFELDLSGQSGCDIIEQITWLIRSLAAPYEIRANEELITPDDIGTHHTKLIVWTNDRTNADFLLLVHELGVNVVRAFPNQQHQERPPRP